MTSEDHQWRPHDTVRFKLNKSLMVHIRGKYWRCFMQSRGTYQIDFYLITYSFTYLLRLLLLGKDSERWKDFDSIILF